MRRSRAWKTGMPRLPLALASALLLASGCATQSLPATVPPDPRCDAVILRAHDRLSLGYDLDRPAQIKVEECALDYAARLNCGQGAATEGCKRFEALGR